MIKFMKVKQRKYVFYLRGPRVRGVTIWNMLPINVQQATTNVKFKKYMREICRT